MNATKIAVFGLLALGAAAPSSSADTRQNPYQPIVERNPFSLKPPPPPDENRPKEEQKPPPNVKLTGISNLFQKRAMLEITEQGTAAPTRPGQPPPPASGTVHRPILLETEGAFGVEVLSIDVEKSIVRIRNNGVESDLTFEAPKLSSGPTPGTPPGPQPRGASVNMNADAAAGQQPMVISSQNAQTSGGGGVTMLGGTPSTPGATAGAPNASGVTTYGGATTTGVPTPLGSDTGLRTIPSRTIRTPSANGEQGQVDPAQQAIMMEAQRLRQQQRTSGRSGVLPPPLPPGQSPPPQAE